MPSAATVRLQIEAALADRSPSALTPRVRGARPVIPTGIGPMDNVLNGGLPIGAITEITGPECSGRTTAALSFVARITQAEKVCAWVDVSDNLQPESAAAAGVDLSRLLWVRCGVQTRQAARSKPEPRFQLPHKCLVAPPAKKGLHGGGFGPHPRAEAHGLSGAVGQLLQPGDLPHVADAESTAHHERQSLQPSHGSPQHSTHGDLSGRPWTRLEQALRVTDLLLQGGGFSAIVLDMASIRPEHASRVPLATWFRYRAAADKTQAVLLLLTQHPCANSSAELLVRLTATDALQDEATVFTGMQHRVEVHRRRFEQNSNVISIKKPSHRETVACWQSRTSWAAPR